MNDLIGYLAAFLTTACYIPQTLHVLRERKTHGISLFAYLTLTTGITFWVLYGVLIGNWPIILCNGVTLPLLLVIVAMKIRLG